MFLIGHSNYRQTSGAARVIFLGEVRLPVATVFSSGSSSSSPRGVSISYIVVLLQRRLCSSSSSSINSTQRTIIGHSKNYYRSLKEPLWVTQTIDRPQAASSSSLGSSSSSSSRSSSSSYCSSSSSSRHLFFTFLFIISPQSLSLLLI